MSTTDSTRLANFVADLASDPLKLQSYVADPAGEMAAAALTDEERGLLSDPGARALTDYMWDPGPKPISEDDPG